MRRCARRFEAFAPPLGTAPVDRTAIAALADLPSVTLSDTPHAMEHALEVELPFLQTVLNSFSVVPLAVGDAGPSDVAVTLAGPGRQACVDATLSQASWQVASLLKAFVGKPPMASFIPDCRQGR